MSRTFIPFLAFLILLLLAISFPFDFATSVVPGWHTTIFPPYFIWTFIVVIALLLVAIGYWLLSKRTDRINWTLFAIHCALTIPTVFFVKLPSFLVDFQKTNQDDLISVLAFRMKLIPIAWALFITGQLLFLVYFFRTIRNKRNSIDV